MNTAVLSPAYEMVEIGRIPVDGLPLRRAQEIVLSRMRMKHQGLRVIDEPVNLRVGKNEALRWSYAWPSKTGLTIYERNTLIAYEGSVRTVTARTARSDYKSYLEFYDRIVMTFRPNEPAK